MSRSFIVLLCSSGECSLSQRVRSTRERLRDWVVMRSYRGARRAQGSRVSRSQSHRNHSAGKVGALPGVPDTGNRRYSTPRAIWWPHWGESFVRCPKTTERMRRPLHCRVNQPQLGERLRMTYSSGYIISFLAIGSDRVPVQSASSSQITGRSDLTM